MPDIEQEERQQELFAEFSGASKLLDRFPLIQKTNKPILVSTSLEQILLVAISLILMGCFVFFLGVLRGKLISSELTKTQTKSKAPVSLSMEAGAPRAVVKPQVSKPYTIQLATYKRLDLAQKEVARLKKAGMFSLIISTGE